MIPYDELVEPDDPNQFIRITMNDEDEDATRTVAALPSTLVDLGLTVSTGRVVDFRSRDSLVEAGVPGSVPLVYPGNLRSGEVNWPRSMGKAQGFVSHCDKDRKMLLPSGCYVLVKRFSAKEDRRRIVAAMWTARASLRSWAGACACG